MSESILIAAIVLNLFVDHASSYITIAVRPRREARCVVQSTTDDHEDEEPMAVRSPLRMLGPYPVISLRFPDIATPEQLKEQQKINGESGVALNCP